MTRHVVARVEDVAPGAARKVEVAGRDIALFNVGGTFYAIADRCPHEGASLAKGKIVALVESDGPGHYCVSRPGEMVRCPWHGWEFDVKTGKSWCDPARTKVRSFDVAVASGEALAEGPYVAETFPVTVEGAYVVIEV